MQAVLKHLQRSILLAVVLICFFEFFYNFFSEKKSFSSIPPIIEQKTTCTQSLSSSPEQLLLYVTDTQMGRIMSDYLCASNAISKQFGDVALVVGHSDYDTFRYINYGLADVALVKENAAEAFNATEAHNLQPLGHYSDYEAFFIALREKPVLTKEYFLDKRIGLLDYPTSRSGHIAPKSTFQALDLKESALTLKYYNSHAELRQKLIAGEIDVISSYWDENDESRLSASYKTKIALTFSGVKWYLKGANKNPDLVCEIQKAAEYAGQQHSSQYYSDVQWQSPCASQGES